MQAQLIASFGLVAIGLVATGWIYGLSAARVVDPAVRTRAQGWTVWFAVSICMFCGAAPLLAGQAAWLLLFPLFGVARSLDALHRLSDDAGKAAS